MILQFAECLLIHVTFLRISPPLLYAGPHVSIKAAVTLKKSINSSRIESDWESAKANSFVSYRIPLYTFHSAWVECIWSQQSGFAHLSELNYIRFEWTRFLNLYITKFESFKPRVKLICISCQFWRYCRVNGSTISGTINIDITTAAVIVVVVVVVVTVVVVVVVDELVAVFKFVV